MAVCTCIYQRMQNIMATQMSNIHVYWRHIGYVPEYQSEGIWSAIPFYFRAQPQVNPPYTSPAVVVKLILL